MRESLDPETYRLRMHRFHLTSRLILGVPSLVIIPIVGLFVWLVFSTYTVRLVALATVDIIVLAMEALALLVAGVSLLAPKKCDFLLMMSAARLYFVSWALVLINITCIIYLFATGTEFEVYFILGLAINWLILSPIFLGQWFLVRKLFE